MISFYQSPPTINHLQSLPSGIEIDVSEKPQNLLIFRSVKQTVSLFKCQLHSNLLQSQQAKRLTACLTKLT